MPVGVLTAIFTSSSRRKRLADSVRLMLNVLAGVPTIVIGVFIFGLLVVGHGQSAYAAAIALSIVMVPLIARSVDEVLVLVPSSLQDAAWRSAPPRAHAVDGGAPRGGQRYRHRDHRRGRAGGRRDRPAALHLVDRREHRVTTDPNQPMNSIPLSIFVNSESPSVHDQQQAWAAALVLIVGVLDQQHRARCCRRGRRQIERPGDRRSRR